MTFRAKYQCSPVACSLPRLKSHRKLVGDLSSCGLPKWEAVYMCRRPKECYKMCLGRTVLRYFVRIDRFDAESHLSCYKKQWRLHQILNNHVRGFSFRPLVSANYVDHCIWKKRLVSFNFVHYVFKFFH